MRPDGILIRLAIVELERRFELPKLSRLITNQLHLTSLVLQHSLMGKVGFEPTEPEGNGFTGRPNSPSLALTHRIEFKIPTIGTCCLRL